MSSSDKKILDGLRASTNIQQESLAFLLEIMFTTSLTITKATNLMSNKLNKDAKMKNYSNDLVTAHRLLKQIKIRIKEIARTVETIKRINSGNVTKIDELRPSGKKSNARTVVHESPPVPFGTESNVFICLPGPVPFLEENCDHSSK